MKRIFTQLIFCSFCLPIFAQELTLDYMNTPVLHTNPFGSGFIAGTNGYGDVGKYQRFDLAQGIRLKAISIFLGHKEVVGTPDEITIVVRSKKDSIPDQYLDAVTRTLDKFAEPDNPTRIELSQPLTFAALDSFFVGLEWATTADDQFAMLADKPGEGDLKNRAWEQYNDGTYHSFNEQSNFSWKLDTDLHIRLHFTAVSGAGEANEFFDALAVQPNPAAEQTRLFFDLKKSGAVQVEVLNLQGQVLTQILNENLPAGSHSARLETTLLPAGIYAFRLRCGSAVSTKIFSVGQ